MQPFNRDELLVTLRAYGFDGCFVPSALHEGIARYVCFGYRPGCFLEAVLCNDLLGAFERADDLNKQMMSAIVFFLNQHVPAVCWGSRKAFEDWLGHAGAGIRRDSKRPAACIDCGSCHHITGSAHCREANKDKCDK